MQDELQLPPSTEKVVELTLSKEEDLYYRHLYRSLVYKLGKDQSLQPQQILQLRYKIVVTFLTQDKHVAILNLEVPIRKNSANEEFHSTKWFNECLIEVYLNMNLLLVT